MDNKIMISIVKDFSVAPGPRYVDEGDYSGQDFRERVLAPKYAEAIAGGNRLVVDLDGTLGYGTSFLEEAFGGLVRVNEYSPEDLKANIDLISEEEPYLKEDIYEYIDKAND